MAGGLSRSYKAVPVLVPRRKRVMARRKPMVVKGYTRTGGFYGRFTGRRAGSARSAELKFLDTASSTLFTTAGAVNTNLNVIPLSTTESGRIGRKITIKSIHIRGDIIHNPISAVTASNLVRIIVIQDKQANGATFAVGDYLASANPLGHRQLSNTDRFRMLGDTTISLTSQAAESAGYGEVRKKYTFYKKCNIDVEYNGSNGVIAEQRSNSVAILMIADTGAVTTFSYNARIRYSDN